MALTLAELRRGFKAWCERAAGGYRRDLGLRKDEALDPFELAEFLGVSVITPEALAGLETSVVHHLRITDPGSWSAVTLIKGQKKLVILNSAHGRARQNSDLSHELSHVILEHKPTQVFFGPGGALLMREFDKVQEHEAECLSSVLLVPRDALLSLLPKIDEETAASQLGVSTLMLKMRRNLTGVDRQLGRRW